jgi:hypothetical protein
MAPIGVNANNPRAPNKSRMRRLFLAKNGKPVAIKAINTRIRYPPPHHKTREKGDDQTWTQQQTEKRLGQSLAIT